MGGAGGGGSWGETGLLRMFSSSVGGQVSWLIPSALILLVSGLWLRGRRPRTDLRRAAYLVWGGWLVVTMLVFSLMAGIFHEYYTVALAPSIAALVGMGAVELWERRDSAVAGVALAASIAAAATWSFILLSRTTAYGDWLRVSVLAVGMAAALLVLAVRWMHASAVPFVLAAALVAGLAGPAAYTASTTAQAHTGSIVTAGPAGSGGGPGGGMRGGGPPPQQGQAGTTPRPGARAPVRRADGGTGGLLDASMPSTVVVAALSQDADRFTWVAAAVGSQTAAGLQLGTQLPVMAIGGFNGSDPSPTLAQFQDYVANGRIHYFAGGGRGFGSQNGGSSASSEISSWVQENFTAVTIDGSTFYDLTQPVSSPSSTVFVTGRAMTTMTVPRIQLSQQVIRFAVVGLVTTALHLGLFAALVRGGAASQLANGIALVIATLVNTGINRAWTFGISGRRRLALHHAQALAIFAITYAATTVALALLGAVAPAASTAVQTAVVLVANVLSTAARFVVMQRWIFVHPAQRGARGERPPRGGIRRRGAARRWSARLSVGSVCQSWSSGAAQASHHGS